MRVPLLAMWLGASLLACGAPGAPTAAPATQATFIGRSEGCSDFQMARASADARRFLVVSVSRKLLGLATGTIHTYALGPSLPGVSVHVDVFPKPLTGETPYCNDVGGQSTAPVRWSARRGSVIIALKARTDGREGYYASVRLANLELVSPSGQVLVVAEEAILDQQVGWYPG